jgi:hypothetical protein
MHARDLSELKECAITVNVPKLPGLAGRWGKVTDICGWRIGLFLRGAHNFDEGHFQLCRNAPVLVDVFEVCCNA